MGTRAQWTNQPLKMDAPLLAHWYAESSQTSVAEDITQTVSPDVDSQEAQMSLHARNVLEDCKRAWRWLDEESDADRYRLLWVCALALLRAVGHVLHKVDAEHNDGIRVAVEALYRSWRDNREANSVFWHFIEEERNLILKQYELRYEEAPTVLIPSTINPSAYQLDENLFCPLTDGPFAGEDGRDMIEQAISWWETQLVSIEERIG